MITLVLTYRNRSEDILVKCLDSLATQSTKNFNTVLVNYGSNKTHTELLENTLKNYSFINYLFCDVSQQLWCKSKAINTVLKKCDTSHFFVGDIDMMYHKNFIETLETLKNKSVTYFQVGFLSQTESSKEVTNFEDYAINFKSNEEATGMTLYPTDVLKGINGYDEFYHGWGSEDTDTHLRL